MKKPRLHSARRDRRRRSPRRGMVLIVVLVTVAFLTVAAYAFARLMFAEQAASDLSVHQVQARAAAESGVELARMFLVRNVDSRIEQGGWYDNPTRFRGIMVNDGMSERQASAQYGAPPHHRARFSLLSPRYENDEAVGLRFGWEDESARLNLNVLAKIEEQTPGAGRDWLMKLPGMTEDVADAILDWLDADDEPREYGAESETYLGMNPPYGPKNGPLESVEELLLVRGVTPALLFGSDANRNGLFDRGELSVAAATAGDASSGALQSGWARYLTIFSMESNLRPDGRPKVNLNQDDLEKLYNEVLDAVGDESVAKFVVLYRQNGPYQQSSGAPTGGTGGGESGGAPSGAAPPATAPTGSAPSSGASGRSGGSGSTAKPPSSSGSAPSGGSTSGGRSTSGSGGSSTRSRTSSGRSGSSSGVSTGGGVAGGIPVATGSGVSVTGGGTLSLQNAPLDFTQAAKAKFGTVLDLVGARVQLPAANSAQSGRSGRRRQSSRGASGQGDGSGQPADQAAQPVIIDSPIPDAPEEASSFLPQWMDSVGLDASAGVAGRINVNLASRAVLSGVPGMTDEALELIVSQRPADPSTAEVSFRYPTWLWEKGIVTLDEMKALMPYLCGEGSVFRVQSVGFFDQGAISARVEAVIQATSQPPRVVFWREMSHLGRGYSLETLGAETTGRTE